MTSSFTLTVYPPRGLASLPTPTPSGSVTPGLDLFGGWNAADTAIVLAALIAGAITFGIFLFNRHDKKKKDERRILIRAPHWEMDFDGWDGGEPSDMKRKIGISNHGATAMDVWIRWVSPPGGMVEIPQGDKAQGESVVFWPGERSGSVTIIYRTQDDPTTKVEQTFSWEEKEPPEVTRG